MAITLKCQYALRALFELARRDGDGTARIGDIADAQKIPMRFLEVILKELKQGGFTVSRRGKAGGYALSRPPADITVGDVIRFVQGPLSPVDQSKGSPARDDVFGPLWDRVEAATAEIYDSTTLHGLLDAESERLARVHPNFHI